MPPSPPCQCQLELFLSKTTQSVSLVGVGVGELSRACVTPRFECSARIRRTATRRSGGRRYSRRDHVIRFGLYNPLARPRACSLDVDKEPLTGSAETHKKLSLLLLTPGHNTPNVEPSRSYPSVGQSQRTPGRGIAPQ